MEAQHRDKLTCSNPRQSTLDMFWKQKRSKDIPEYLAIPNCCSTDNQPQGMGQEVSMLIQPWPLCFIMYFAGLRNIKLIY